MLVRGTVEDGLLLEDASPGEGEGVLAVRVTGKVRHPGRFSIVVGGTREVRFVCPGLSAAVVRGGEHSLRLKQSRVGVNVGAVWIEPGMCTEVTVIANWFTGPQYGRFARTATLLAEW